MVKLLEIVLCRIAMVLPLTPPPDELLPVVKLPLIVLSTIDTVEPTMPPPRELLPSVEFDEMLLRSTFIEPDAE